MADEKQFCTFFLDNLYFGVEVLHVQEVFRYQEVTEVPLASPVVKGLINLRGQIITAIDLRRRLELGEHPPEKPPMNIVVRTTDGAVSLLVDEIGDVLEVPAESSERVPDAVTGLTRELLKGVYKLKDQLLLILDTDKGAQIDGAATA